MENPRNLEALTPEIRGIFPFFPLCNVNIIYNARIVNIVESEVCVHKHFQDYIIVLWLNFRISTNDFGRVAAFDPDSQLSHPLPLLLLHNKIHNINVNALLNNVIMALCDNCAIT